MKDINTSVLCEKTWRLFLLSFFLCAPRMGWADDKVTRVYLLKNSDVTNVERVINIAVRDPSKSRVIGGNTQRLVVSDTPDQQDIIAQLLPVIDKPTNETDPDKIQMKMLMNAAQYLRQQKIAMKSAAAGYASPVVASPAVSKTSPSVSTPAMAPMKPYVSIYASDDAKLIQGPRNITEEPALLSLSSLQLKGIYKGRSGSLALLSFENSNYTARDGRLFENNRSALKNVTSQVFKDHVLLVGPDHIPRDIKFKSSI